MRPLATTLLGLILLAVGGFNLLRAIGWARLGRRAMNWPRVYGKVTTSRMEIRGAGRNMRHAATIAYTFEVDDEIYHGSMLNGRGVILGMTAERARDEYPRGRRVWVYFNPEDPSESMLEPGLTDEMMIVLIGSPVVILLGVFALARVVINNALP